MTTYNFKHWKEDNIIEKLINAYILSESTCENENMIKDLKAHFGIEEDHSVNNAMLDIFENFVDITNDTIIEKMKSAHLNFNFSKIDNGLSEEEKEQLPDELEKYRKIARNNIHAIFSEELLQEFYYKQSNGDRTDLMK